MTDRDVTRSEAQELQDEISAMCDQLRADGVPGEVVAAFEARIVFLLTSLALWSVISDDRIRTEIIEAIADERQAMVTAIRAVLNAERST